MNDKLDNDALRVWEWMRVSVSPVLRQSQITAKLAQRCSSERGKRDCSVRAWNALARLSNAGIVDCLPGKQWDASVYWLRERMK